MLLADAADVRVGTTPARVYAGTTLVWPPWDDATVRYLAATGLDVSYAPALDDLVVGLKAAGLWAKMSAIYPFIGGTAQLHRWNLIDPRDADAAYRLTFNGTAGTHSGALGYRANPEGAGADGSYADTHLVPLGVLDQDSTHLAFYSLLDVTPGDRAEIGCYDWDRTGHRFHVIACYDGNWFYYGMAEAGATNTPMPASTGLFVATRTASAQQDAYRDGVNVGTSTNPSVELPTVPVWVGGIDAYRGRSDLPCGFASIGSGLTAQNVADLDAVVQAYETALSRQVGAPVIAPPRGIPGLALWLEGDRITDAVDGGQITSWPDDSGKGYHATPVAAPPVWRQVGIGGQPCVEFAPTPTRMTVQGWGSALSGKTDYTLFQVIRQDDFGNYPVITCSPTDRLWDFITEFDLTPGVYWGHGNGHYRMYSAALVPGQPYLLTYSAGMAGGPRFYVNGVEITTIGWYGPSGDLLLAIPQLPADVTLGSYYDNSLGLTGQIGAMLWYDRNLIDSERVQIQDYLMTKYGL